MFFSGTLEDWSYWGRGSNPGNAWSGAGSAYGQMLTSTKKSKGQKRKHRGVDLGYSSALRAQPKVLPPPPAGGTGSGDASGLPRSSFFENCKYAW